MPNQSLHLTAIPLRYIASGELNRSRRLRRRERPISSPVFYLFAYLESHREEYVAGLQALSGKTSTAWTRWIGFFLGAMDEQSRENARKAQAIINLYGRLKGTIIDLTRSQYAVPLLDCRFDQPVFTSSVFDNCPGMPSKPMVMNRPGRLRNAGILTVLREGRGRRPHILALAELVNICEDSAIF